MSCFHLLGSSNCLLAPAGYHLGKARRPIIRFTSSRCSGSSVEKCFSCILHCITFLTSFHTLNKPASNIEFQVWFELSLSLDCSHGTRINRRCYHFERNSSTSLAAKYFYISVRFSRPDCWLSFMEQCHKIHLWNVQLICSSLDSSTVYVSFHYPHLNCTQF